jgi:hypothetical protein
MQYISPFVLLGIDLEEINRKPDSINVSFLRKKMLAEFELNNSVTIKTPAGELSKNDVLVVMDQLQNPQVLKFHLEIARDPILLNFLQYNGLEGDFLNNPVYSQKEFLDFITPYFAHSYCSLIINILENEGESNPHIYKIPVLITPGEESKWLSPVRRKLFDLVSTIEGWAPKVKPATRVKVSPNVQRVYGFNVLRMLNLLQSNFFEHQVEAYVKASFTVVENCINDKNNGFRNEELVSFILKRLQSLNLSPENAKLVEHYQKFVKGKVEVLVAEKEEKSGFFRGIWVILVIVFAIVRIASTCDSTNSTSNSNFHEKYKYAYSLSDIHETDTAKAKRLYYRFKRAYTNIYRDSEVNLSPLYSPFRTGENPFVHLQSLNTSTTGKKFILRFSNKSDKHILAIFNTPDSNAYFFIKQKESFTMGTNAEKARIFFIAGEEWDSGFDLPEPVYANEVRRGEDISGNFTKPPDNLMEIMNNISIRFDARPGFENASFMFLKSGGCLEIKKKLPPTSVEPVSPKQNQSEVLEVQEMISAD